MVVPLRVYAAAGSEGRKISSNEVAALLAREDAEGLRDPDRYRRFAEDVAESHRALLGQLIELRRGQVSTSSATAPLARGTLPPQLLRDPDGLPRVHGRPKCVQAIGRFTPGTAYSRSTL